MIVAMSSHRTALRRAIKLAKGQRALARLLTKETGKRVSQAHVWGWLHEAKKMPADWCRPIERVTARIPGGPVRADEFRSDLFGQDQAA